MLRAVSRVVLIVGSAALGAAGAIAWRADLLVGYGFGRALEVQEAALPFELATPTQLSRLDRAEVGDEGYWLSRGLGMDRTSARTVAFEVGLQNGGMASGIAGAMGKLGTLGLAAAVFSPWMNVSGSILANYWRKRPTDANTGADSAATTSDSKGSD